MTEGHIFIQGVISPWQDKAAEDWGEVNIKQVTQQIQDNADAEKLIVHIHSPGGDVDEGFGIHDILVSSGKEIETRIEGLCASIATVIALAGSSRLMTENSEFMIHNPWGYSEGDADDLQKYADMVKAAENKVIDFYAQKTGADKETIDAMMKNETWLSAEKAKELGFITDIIVTTKAVAKINFNKTSSKDTIMNKKELEQSLDTRFEKFLNKIKNLVSGSEIKALTVTAGDGTVLDFGDQIESEDQIDVGMSATIEGGGTPEGNYVMPDGSTLVFESGTVTEIIPADSSEDNETEMEALKAENEDLKKQLADLQASAKETNDAVVAFKKELQKFKAQVKSDISSFDPDSIENTDPGAPQNRFAGKPKIGI